MKILGISNPNFFGVTIATKALVTDHMPVNHTENYAAIQTIARAIIAFQPDALIVGGWSTGYDQIMEELRTVRRFPIIGIYHSTPFHGHFFGESFQEQFLTSAKRGDIDYTSFVQPQTTQFYRKMGMKNCVWIPHYFPKATHVKREPKFRIGLLGGTDGWHKNGYGAAQVAAAYSRKNENVEVVQAHKYDKSHPDFLRFMSTFNLLIHPSHLECYSNTIQEAWARGIPVIMSTANVGLYKNPLLDKIDIENLKNMFVTESNIDPTELYNQIEFVHKTWELSSQTVIQIHAKLLDRAKKYSHQVISTIKRIQTFSEDPEAQILFEAPFVEKGFKW